MRVQGAGSAGSAATSIFLIFRSAVAQMGAGAPTVASPAHAHRPMAMFHKHVPATCLHEAIYVDTLPPFGQWRQGVEPLAPVLCPEEDTDSDDDEGDDQDATSPQHLASLSPASVVAATQTAVCLAGLARMPAPALLLARQQELARLAVAEVPTAQAPATSGALVCACRT